MFWIIASLVLAFMLAPILWIVPSPRQRRQMRLRERARELGITVQIATFPQTRRQRVRKEANAEVATVEALADLMNRMIDEDFADEQ